MDGLNNFIKNIGVTRLIAMGLVTVMLIGFMLAISSRLSQQNMGLLYGGLEPAEASEVVNRLSAMNVNFELRGESQIYVPQSQVGLLRLQMAGEGLVGSSTTGYEIFDNTSSFGTTALVQDINARRALEGELARTITSIPVVKGARVHIVLPKRQLFSRNQVEATASVTLNLANRRLEEEQVSSIVHLVAAAVPDLSPKRVTVVDNRGNLLSSDTSKESESGTGGSAAAKFRDRLENEYEASIVRMLERVVGQGNVIAQVSADVNFDRVEENAEIFNPDQQVARSEQLIEEQSQSENTEPGPPAGLAANVPGQDPQGFQVSRSESDGRMEETINYEISRTVRTFVREGGKIENLSVAVLVEGDYTTVDGEEQYVPMADATREKLQALVMRSIGFDAERGDKIELIDMPFEAMEGADMYEPPLFTRDDILRLTEYGLLFAGLVMILLFVVRPILKASQKANQAEKTAANMQNLEPAGKKGAGGGIEAEGSDEETMIDLAKVEGRVRQSTIKKVTEIIDNNPDQSVSVIRSWLAPEATP